MSDARLARLAAKLAGEAGVIQDMLIVQSRDQYVSQPVEKKYQTSDF